MKRITTSINLDENQIEFIKKYNINLSAFMRKKVDELMEKYKKGGLIE